MSTHEVTLAIDMADGLNADAGEARALGSLLAEDYRSADPFPHIVIDGILPEGLIRKILAHFPQKRLANDVVFDIGYGGQHKRQVMPEECDGFVREFFHFMSSASTVADDRLTFAASIAYFACHAESSAYSSASAYRQ